MCDITCTCGCVWVCVCVRAHLYVVKLSKCLWQKLCVRKRLHFTQRRLRPCLTEREWRVSRKWKTVDRASEYLSTSRREDSRCCSRVVRIKEDMFFSLQTSKNSIFCQFLRFHKQNNCSLPAAIKVKPATLLYKLLFEICFLNTTATKQHNR